MLLYATMQGMAALRINPDALRTLRERTGLTLRALGEAAELNHSFIRELEAGEKNASPQTIKKLADALGVSQLAIAHPDTEEVAS